MTENNATDLSYQNVNAQLTAPGQDYELVEAEVHGHSCRVFKNAPPTLRDLFHDNRSDETFLVYLEERYSYEDIYQQSAKIGKILVEQYNIKKGDRVSISMRNYPEWISAFTAVTSIGAIAVAMNALWSTEEMEYGLEDSGSKVLIADQQRVDRATLIYKKLGIDVIAVRPDKQLPEDVRSLQELLATVSDCEMPAASIEPNDDATIFYTSGSTGHPKGAVSCHRNIISALLSWELGVMVSVVMNGIEPEEPKYPPATLLAVPLFHATGALAVYLSSYRSQRCIVSMYKWDAALAATIIEQERISSFVAPAAMTGDLIEEARVSNRDLSSLATVGGGGAPRAPDQVKNIASVFANALPNTGWGMTETNAIGTGIGGEDYLAHPGSSGRCAAVLDLAIVDEDGNNLPAGERGELRVRGASVISGYWQRPEANAETFDNGWLLTGDVAYIDEEGYLYIVDRIKDLVIRGGENIGCAEVEAALLTHEHIIEASVYAVPDDRLGEEVGTTIFASEKLKQDELKEFLAAHIARFKIPRYFKFSENPLPRIASGKIDKKVLREIAVKDLG